LSKKAKPIIRGAARNGPDGFALRDWARIQNAEEGRGIAGRAGVLLLPHRNRLLPISITLKVPKSGKPDFGGARRG
jgi:hypothetical protein